MSLTMTMAMAMAGGRWWQVVVAGTLINQNDRRDLSTSTVTREPAFFEQAVEGSTLARKYRTNRGKRDWQLLGLRYFTTCTAARVAVHNVMHLFMLSDVVHNYPTRCPAVRL